MVNNNVILILNQLSRREMTRFSEFVQSPYFNKHKDVRNLVDYLSQIYPDFNEKKCHRETIFQYLYPALPHRQSQLAIIFTYTLRLLEQFLEIEQAEKDAVFENRQLFFKALRERDLLFLIKTTWEENVGKVSEVRSIRAAAPAGIQDSRYFETQLGLAAEQDAIAMQLGQHESEFLVEKQQWLDAFYLTEKLKDACELYQRSILLKKNFEEDSLFKKMVEAVREAPEIYENFPPVVVYEKLYKLLKTTDLTQYRSTLDFIFQRKIRLPQPTLQSIYNYLQNYCIRQINLGNQDFLRELFDLYRFQLEHELLMVAGHLPEWHFKNIVTTGLRLDEHEWVRSFLENYRGRLHPKVEENAYSYNLAAYFHHLENYDQVLRLLLQVEYTDVRYNLDAKSLLLRTYYDLEAGEALHSLAEAFKQYLKRNKSLSEFQKKGYFNLLTFTRKAFRLKTNREFTNRQKWELDLQKLHADMASAETVFNKSWLEGKVMELEGK